VLLLVTLVLLPIGILVVAFVVRIRIGLVHIALILFLRSAGGVALDLLRLVGLRLVGIRMLLFV